MLLRNIYWKITLTWTREDIGLKAIMNVIYCFAPLQFLLHKKELLLVYAILGKSRFFILQLTALGALFKKWILSAICSWPGRLSNPHHLWPCDLVGKKDLEGVAEEGTRGGRDRGWIICSHLITEPLYQRPFWLSSQGQGNVSVEEQSDAMFLAEKTRGQGYNQRSVGSLLQLVSGCPPKPHASIGGRFGGGWI